MSSVPDVSIVIATRNASETIEDCIKSIKDQETRFLYEIIIVDSSTDGTDEIIRSGYPELRLYTFDTRKFCGDARNIAVSVARAPIVAFIDADCTTAKGWVDAVIEAHQAPHLAIGGAIGNGTPESYVGWAAYFTEFSQWKPDYEKKELTDIAGASMTYKKEVFEEFGSFIEGTYCSDTEFHWRLQERGQHLLFAPSILVYHRNIAKLSNLLLHEFHHGLSFAKVRVQSRSFSKLKTWVYIVLIPLVLCKLITKNIFLNICNRVYGRHYIMAFPLTALGIMFWTLGELKGYIVHALSTHSNHTQAL